VGLEPFRWIDDGIRRSLLIRRLIADLVVRRETDLSKRQNMAEKFFRRVLVGADGSQASQIAINAAIAVAKRFGSELYCVGVITSER
jgi:phosphomannomutase